jgi:sulfur relay (sulfurtransferase) complex TusBCD TusD component (DsrE family)
VVATRGGDASAMAELIEEVEMGRMIDLAQWTKESDSVVTF